MLAEGQSTPVKVFFRNTKKAAMKPVFATSLYHIRVDKKSKWIERTARPTALCEARASATDSPIVTSQHA
jgi:hypothetical protein